MLLHPAEGATQVAGGRTTNLRHPRSYVKYILANIRWIASASILVNHSFAESGGPRGKTQLALEGDCTGLDPSSQRGGQALIHARVANGHRWVATTDAFRPNVAGSGRQSLLCLTERLRSCRLRGSVIRGRTLHLQRVRSPIACSLLPGPNAEEKVTDQMERVPRTTSVSEYSHQRKGRKIRPKSRRRAVRPNETWKLTRKFLYSYAGGVKFARPKLRQKLRRKT